jgi:hypothetical protein
VTEQEWDECADPWEMLESLRMSGKLSERKAHLFGAACCRRVSHLLTDERSRRGVEVAERFAEGAAPAEELQGALGPALQA